MKKFKRQRHLANILPSSQYFRGNAEIQQAFAKKKFLRLPIISGNYPKFTLEPYAFLSTPSAMDLLKFTEKNKNKS